MSMDIPLKSHRTKHRTRIQALLFILFLWTFSVCVTPAFIMAKQVRSPQYIRGVWVSTVTNIDYPSRRNCTVEEMKMEANRCLDTIRDLGLNTVFLQVRPMGDALYSSKIYPWSAFLTGQQGVAPADNFDPLQWWVEGAHERNLQLHAWVNPYRVTTGSFTRDDLAANNPARLHPEWTFEHNGKIYLNPGLPEVRKLVVSGIVEIVKNYKVDGIHMDDYFYPARDMEYDRATFEQYGHDFESIEDWRRHNVDLLIQGVQKAIKRTAPRVHWGVSPAGIWANKSHHPLGSETRGNETYFNLYADTRGWVQNEYIDYITPQIYWHIGFDEADFKTLVDWWSNVVEGTQTKLYIGMAAYRVDPNSPTESWRSVEELYRQWDYLKTKPLVNGFVLFTMHSLQEGTVVHEAIQQYRAKPKK